jgi:glycosyltransferase involved in cell wall biosynthesis
MIKVLAINADNDGVGLHRVLAPHISIDEPDVIVDIRFINDHTLPILDERYLSQYQIFFYNKPLPFDQNQLKIFNDIIKKYNIKTVYDIDDYWILDSTHNNYKTWKQNNGTQITLDHVKNNDYITTTTPIFADYIKEYNKNVIVLPNAINFNEQEWCSNKIESDKIRFIWGGGIAHMQDLRLMTKSFESFDKDFLNKAQVYLCGFDLRLHTEKGMVQKANEDRNPWIFFEDIFTNKKKWVKNPVYYSWLNNYDNVVLDEFKSEFYQRRWTKPVLTYGEMYNEADVALAPIKNNITYNFVKSQLKVIEAGAHKCPIIASEFGPYTIDDIEGKYDKKPKGFLVNENDKLGWYNNMKWFTENPNALIDYGLNNYEYIKNNYSMEVVNKIRCDFYKKIANT